MRKAKSSILRTDGSTNGASRWTPQARSQSLPIFYTEPHFSFCLPSPRRQIILLATRRGARVVEWDGLENRCARKRTEGSNPSLSAN